VKHCSGLPDSGKSSRLKRLLICPRESTIIYMEKNKEGVIIADTSGLVSLFSPDDRNHAEALKAAQRLQHEKRDILIPAAVFVEFVNVMGRKAGHAVTLAAVTELTPPFLVLSEPSSLLDSPALFKFEAVSEAVSFTDCLVMTVADEYGTKDIFGFDKQFADAGYNRLAPASDSPKAA
jgi:predicted nucleic acid-binding protein